jgi:uncharacterized Fe-S cluster-containing radical SAM superfamily protein
LLDRKLFDPIALSDITERIVSRKRIDGGFERRYWRFRGGRWYGGIATADAVGCCLRCVFCWSWRVRDNPYTGGFYSARDVWVRLREICARRGYRQVRVSGCEPTIAFNHLEELIRLFESEGRYLFILETNGILIGAYRGYTERLSEFRNLHVRVSIKGCSPDEFSMLTLAEPSGFELQLNALKNLIDEEVSCHPAVMLSFSSDESKAKLIDRLKAIDDKLVEGFEEEYVFLYPHVEAKLKEYGLKPRIAFKPDAIPNDLI